MAVHTYCRLCEGYCGVVAEVADGRPVSLSADPNDPVSEGFLCDTARRSLGALGDARRITRPMKRVDGRLVPASWEDAIREIGAQLRTIRGQSGARSVGLVLGEGVQHSTSVLARSLAFAMGMGTPNLFSSLAREAGPQLIAAEQMLGHPMSMLSDVGRAHYVVLLDGEQRDSDWGPRNPGQAHERWVQFSRKTKGTKVVVAGPRKTPLAEAVDQHLSIRPGTEPFMLLGLLAATVKGDWGDAQYIRDHTSHAVRLPELLAAWPVDRCADICGVPAAQLSGVGLKFSRAAMGVMHPGAGTFANAHPTVGAWAWIALHTMTANTLRPGGLYEHVGVFDMHGVLSAVPSSSAPRTRVHGLPLLMMQAPDALLADEILTPGEGQVRAVITVGANPVAALPASSRVRGALGGLDLLVCLARTEDETAAQAHWVLPIPHPWERRDLQVHTTPLLPVHQTAVGNPIATAPPDVRMEEDILRDLFAAVRPGVRGSGWGLHVTMLGQLAARADFATWETRLLDTLEDGAADQLAAEPHRLHVGDTDRSQWRLTTSDNRINVAPDAIVELVRQLAAPTADPALPLFLRTSRRVTRDVDALHRDAGAEDPGVGLHPDHGFSDGASVRVRTRFGDVLARVRVDPTLRSDSVDLPAGFAADASALLNPERVDPLCGMPERDGLACAIEQA